MNSPQIRKPGAMFEMVEYYRKPQNNQGLKVFVKKDELEWFKEMHAEARNRSIEVSSYPRFKPELGLEVAMELREVQR